MKTFAEFLSEAWRKFSDSDMTDIVHHHKVAGHDVHVAFTKTGDFQRYHVNFSVNDSPKKKAGVVAPEHHMAILHHVRKTVNRFVNRVKPSSIVMTGNTHEKHAMYRHFAKKLAKEHGAHHFEDRGHHLLHFHWDEK